MVLDASIVLELLANGPLADAIRHDLAERDEPFIVPHLLDIEVVSAIRRLTAGLRLDSHRAEQLLATRATLPADRFGHTPLLGRIWELRHNFTACDASHIALAEATGSILCTTDGKLAKGHRAQVARSRKLPPRPAEIFAIQSVKSMRRSPYDRDANVP
jgi:predicted nucleic acid-binding protein